MNPETVADLLLDPEVGSAVDMVAWRSGARIILSAQRGRVRIEPDRTVVVESGDNPIGDLVRYPNAVESITQIFDSPHAPDVAISHSPRHRKFKIGDHGSLHEEHARAPFLASGAGVRTDGRVPRSLRMVDVAPTIAAVLGAQMDNVDGMVDNELLTGEIAEHAVLFLMDGTNLDMFEHCLTDGSAPTLKRLADSGVRFGSGVLSSFPTVTLANHTTLMTGRHPGHSGVPANEWFDRASNEPRNLLDFGEMMHAASNLAPGVTTIHHAVHAARPDAFTASCFEYCDAAADWSSFGEVRERRRRALPIEPHQNQRVHGEHTRLDWYATMSHIDECSVIDALHILEGPTHPDFLFVNFSLTDESGHNAGPHNRVTRDAITETDDRIRTVLAAIEAAGKLDSTAVFVLSDHGMAESDPDNTVALSEWLQAKGVNALVTEETFVYLDASAAATTA